MSKELHFNGFEMNTPSHIHHGQWRRDGNRRTEYKTLAYWIDTARLLEEGLFDALFLADVVGTYNILGGDRTAAVERGLQIPNNDPFLVVPAAAAATTHLGFAVTALTTYEQPFSNARRFSTLDHFTDGRVAWNVVTGYLPDAARNFGLDAQVKHDERYAVADEYLDVSYKLWEGSWEDDAVLLDAESNRYSDPDGVHDVGHRGTYFRVDGPHLSEPSPQRTPVIYQAGTSTRGRHFSAKNAEAIFVGARTVEEARDRIADIARLAESEYGRSRNEIRFLVGLDVIVAPTEEEAWEKAREYFAYRDVVGYLAHTAGGTGIDFAELAGDDLLVYGGGDHIQSQEESWSGTADRPKQVQDLLDWYEDPTQDPFVVVGNPVQVAERIIELADAADLDGFNLVQYDSHETFASFIELVVPELQRRGRYRTAYRAGETLRERLFPEGGPRLPATHPGAAYRRATRS